MAEELFREANPRPLFRHCYPSSTAKNQGRWAETKQTKALSSKQKIDVLHFVELKRFVSAHDVIQQLKLSVSVEILLKEIEGAPIKTFPGPETVVIQWRNPQSL